MRKHTIFGYFSPCWLQFFFLWTWLWTCGCEYCIIHLNYYYFEIIPCNIVEFFLIYFILGKQNNITGEEHSIQYSTQYSIQNLLFQTSMLLMFNVNPFWPQNTLFCHICVSYCIPNQFFYNYDVVLPFNSIHNQLSAHLIFYSSIL
jgi:hypothetical protein